MDSYIDLDRRFRVLTDSELARADPLADWADYGNFGTLGWTDLMDHPRLVLLAEAGSGKSWELEERARSLKREGKTAFFFALESLARTGLADSLAPNDEGSFDEWIEEGSSPAWFFLDSVDELKLTRQKLRTALRRFAKALNGQLHRTRIWVSSRPTDWRAETDLATLIEILPVAPPIADSLPPDEAFINPLREASQAGSGTRKPDDTKPLLIVALVPLNRERIKTFAVARGLYSPHAFIAELDRQDAWHFARRPLDLADLLRFWRMQGRLGTRMEQHEANIATKLKDDPDRTDSGSLSEDRARLGAERLALALTLTRNRTILYSETCSDAADREDRLDPAAVLSDWTPEDRAALLRRALFDPATYGRVRFHHRSVQEYLAACRLRALRDKGMSIGALMNLLLAERYGCALVIPSRAPIAAWCALWSPEIRREIMGRQPELLLQHGDPGSLPIDERGALLRAFVSAYSAGDWRGLSVERDAIRRLSHPDLTETVRELWKCKPTNQEVIKLLLSLIWQGPLPGCEDIAHQAALNTAIGDIARILGIWGLSALDARESLHQIAQGILSRPDDWSDRVVVAAVPELFPHSLSVDALASLIVRTPQPRSSLSGFAYAARGIALEIDPDSDSAIGLREALAGLIWEHRASAPEFYWPDLQSRFGYLAPALAVLCMRQLEGTVAAAARHDILRGAVIAIHFRDHEFAETDEVRKLTSLLSRSEVSRPIAFWQALTLLNAISPGLSELTRFFTLANGSLLVEPTETDRPWLMAALADTSDVVRRGVALAALTHLRQVADLTEQQVAAIAASIADDQSLLDRLKEYTAPPQPNPDADRRKKEQELRKQEREEMERERLGQWDEWRAGLCADPQGAFSGERRDANIAYLHHWLERRANASYGPSVWNDAAIREAFDAPVAQAARRALSSLWRECGPTLWSRRAESERNAILNFWRWGLTGLHAEALTSGWCADLSHEEAETAAAFATVELNGFPGWLSDLTQTHPRAVDAVIGEELSAQLARAREIEFIPLLQDVSHAPTALKQLFAPRLMDSLRDWSTVPRDDPGAGRSLYALDRLLDILSEVVAGNARETVAALCRDRAMAQPSGKLAFGWLRGLFLCDPVQGVDALEKMLAVIPESSRSARAVGIFAALFGSRGSVPVAPEEPEPRAMVLGRLARTCYRHVARQDDLVHEEVYTPTARDDAERARGFVLKSLTQTPGPHAHQAILALADEPELAGMRDRLAMLAREQAAQDTEPAPLPAPDIPAIDQRFEAPPRDRDALFEVLMDRLADLQHEIAHSDFTSRTVWQRIEAEREMQRMLAGWLRTAARDAYTVCREDEVADAKKPDIRLRTLGDEHRAAIEIKIADNKSEWSVRDFEEALKDQLVGQYLRDRSGRAGCLLLTYAGRKKHWNDPNTGKHLSFEELCNRLRELAPTIEAKRDFEIRLGVFGLDLRDPLGR